MREVTDGLTGNLHLAGRTVVSCLAAGGASSLTEFLHRWVVGYDQVVDAVVYIAAVGLVFIYLMGPALNEIAARKK